MNYLNIMVIFVILATMIAGSTAQKYVQPYADVADASAQIAIDPGTYVVLNPNSTGRAIPGMINNGEQIAIEPGTFVVLNPSPSERAIPGIKFYNGEPISTELEGLYLPVYAYPSPSPSGSYHFITHPPTSEPWGCGSYHITPTYPTFYDNYCLNGNARVISGDTPDLGIGVAASIDIPRNYVITIYESKNYQGNARTFYQSVFTFPEEFYGSSIKILKLSSLEEQDKSVGKNEDIISPEDIDEILSAHNKYRMQVGVKSLIWDDQIAASAKQWANHLAATNTIEHSSSGYGENVAFGNLGTWTNTINYLASEKKCFKNGVMPDIYNGQCDTNPDCAPYKDWRCAGHYSQIVWSSTQKVGCGKSGDYWVLQYSPPGNYIGQKAY